MLHYLFLSFAPGYFTEEIYAFASQCFGRLPDEESYIRNVIVKKTALFAMEIWI